MNAEFVEKIVQAKCLEAQALALLVPESARSVAAAAVRACSEAVLAALDVPGSSSGGSAASCERSKSVVRTDKPSGMRSIVIE